MASEPGVVGHLFLGCLCLHDLLGGEEVNCCMKMRRDPLHPSTLCVGVDLGASITTNSWKIPLNQAQRVASLHGQDELVQALCHVQK